MPESLCLPCPRTRFATAATRSTLVAIDVPSRIGRTMKGVLCGASMTIPANAIAPALTAPPTAALCKISLLSGTLEACAAAAAAAAAAAVARATSKTRVATKITTLKAPSDVESDTGSGGQNPTLLSEHALALTAQGVLLDLAVHALADGLTSPINFSRQHPTPNGMSYLDSCFLIRIPR